MSYFDDNEDRIIYGSSSKIMRRSKMADYDNTNRGAIWKNSKKESDNHPDFTGEINVEGKMFWVSAWKRKEDASEKAPALSFSVKAKDQSPKEAKQIVSGAKAAASNTFDDDDIAF